MCKVLMINGIKKTKMKETIDFIKLMGKEMSWSNKDGLGYAAVDSSGNLFGERWLYNETAFTTTAPVKAVPKADKRIIETFPGLIEDLKKEDEKLPFEYNSFGTVNLEDMLAITLHTRMATSEKGIKNCHPFVNGGVSLIHNGVINNCEEIGMPTSSCDSEAILTSYVENNVMANFENVHAVAKDLKGYYVAGLLSYDENNIVVMDILKGNNDNLNLCYITELETFVFTTSETDVKDVCKKLGFTMESANSVKGDMAVRVDVATGQLIDMIKLKTNVSHYGANTHYWSQRDKGLPAPKYGGPKVVTGKDYHKQSSGFHNMKDYIDSVPSITTLSEAEVHGMMAGNYDA